MLFKIRNAMIFFVIGYWFCKLLAGLPPRDKTIDLPEEWEAVKTGDTLKVYKMNRDTIFIGFYNKANHKDRIY